jgi:Domain of unknown function (DUF5615)
VVYVAELSPVQDDDTVLNQANESAAILITADKNFGELVFRQKRIHNAWCSSAFMGSPLK